MKKTIAIILTIICTLSLFSVAVSAAEAKGVYVTISNSKGELVLVQEKINVTDVDKDNKITINDALFCAHESFYKGGAKAGYSAQKVEGYSGLSLKKLWGETNYGSFGYYVNNESAWSLLDAVKSGDYVNAFAYTDTVGYSDSYSFFDKQTVSTKSYSELELTLSSYSYDANWNLVKSPVSGATITVDGKKTSFVTDKNGKVTIFVGAGEHVISAVCEKTLIVAPCCKVAASFDFMSFVTYIFNMLLSFVRGLFN